MSKLPWSYIYKKETGKEAYGVWDDNGKVDEIPHDTSKLPNIDYVSWLETRLTLALSRIEAAERYIMIRARNEMEEDAGSQVSDYDGDEQSRAFKDWQSTIRAMEGSKPKPIGDNPPKPWTPPEFLPPPPDGGKEGL